MISFTRQQINRAIVAVLAVACILAGLAIGRYAPDEQLWFGSFIRSGLLLGAFWIGMPTRGRAAAWANVSPYWTIVAIAGLVLITRIIKRPQILIPLGVVLVFLMFVVPMFTRPRPPR